MLEVVAHKLHSSSPRSSKGQRERQTNRERERGKERVGRSKKEKKEKRKKDMDISGPELFYFFSNIALYQRTYERSINRLKQSTKQAISNRCLCCAVTARHEAGAKRREKGKGWNLPLQLSPEPNTCSALSRPP